MTSDRAHRRGTAAFGVFLVVLAIVILATAHRSTRVGAGIAALVVGGLGVDAVVSAARGRRALVSRIGPLP